MKSTRLAATGYHQGANIRQAVLGAVLVGGSDAATVTLRNGGAAGEVLLVITAAAVETVPVIVGADGIRFNTDLHVTFTGTAPQLFILTEA